MTDDPLLASLLSAVAAAPDDVPLRLHVADLLAQRGRLPEALQHCTHALTREPTNGTAVALLQRLSTALAAPTPPAPTAPTPPAPTPPAPTPPAFDWTRAEDEVAGIPGLPEPAFVEDRGDPVTEDVLRPERPAVQLADVAGMEEAKRRLELAFLGPVRHPELARTFGASASGGLLLYGPPGCGKTFLARAVAGELGAAFSEIGVTDVLDMWVGRSEQNLAEVFRAARRTTPHVLFLDEIDALGQRRSHLSNASSMRNTVNQLLTEMDSLSGRNDGLFVLGATNHPWDLDPALRRPGRFDRMVLVLPPEAPARAAILRRNLERRPIEGIDLDKLVRLTEHFSGADLVHLCDTAAERGLADSMRTGQVRPVTMQDLAAGLREVSPSTGPWFAAARNVAQFGNTDGSYDELAAYLKKNRRL